MAAPKLLWLCPGTMPILSMRKRSFLLSVAMVPLIGCRTAEEKEQDAVLEKAQTELREDFEKEQRLKNEYAAAHAQHRCEGSAVPEFSKSKLSGSLFQERRFDDHFSLRLRLGKLIEPSSEKPVQYPRRNSTSKYQLIENGQRVCEAPSMLTKDMHPSLIKSDIYTQIFWDPLSHSVLIDEGREWSNIRRIALWQEESGGKRRWISKIIEAPLRPPSSSSDIHPVGTLLGVAHDRLYLEVDGVFYAIPLHELDSAPADFSPPG